MSQLRRPLRVRTPERLLQRPRRRGPDSDMGYVNCVQIPCRVPTHRAEEINEFAFCVPLTKRSRSMNLGCITIYGDPISGNCMKVRFVAERLKIPYRWI